MEQPPQERKLRLSQFIMAYPCNEAQQRQNWERLNQVFQELDKIFELTSVEGEDRWRVSLKALESISAKKAFLGEVFDLHGNPYDLSLTKEAQAHLALFQDEPRDVHYEEDSYWPRQQHEDDDSTVVLLEDGRHGGAGDPMALLSGDDDTTQYSDEYYLPIEEPLEVGLQGSEGITLWAHFKNFCATLHWDLPQQSGFPGCINRWYNAHVIDCWVTPGIVCGLPITFGVQICDNGMGFATISFSCCNDCQGGMEDFGVETIPPITLPYDSGDIIVPFANSGQCARCDTSPMQDSIIRITSSPDDPW